MRSSPPELHCRYELQSSSGECGSVKQQQQCPVQRVLFTLTSNATPYSSTGGSRYPDMTNPTLDDTRPLRR